MININLTRSDDPTSQIEECIEIIQSIEKASVKEKELILNFKDLKWILPCSALLLSSKINDLYNQGIKISLIEPLDNHVKNYLIAIGFPFGKEQDSTTYAPIHHFNRKAGEKGTEIINENCNKIFKIVRENFPPKIHNGIFNIVGDLSDNLDQHSEFTQGSIMVQYYPNKGHVDIGILDNGLTIPKVYEKNEISFINDIEAVSKALEGISTKKGEEGGTRGKGLKDSKKLIIEALKGEFYLISRNGMVFFKGNQLKQQKILEKSFPGTFVYMRFCMPEKDLNIYEYIN